MPDRIRLDAGSPSSPVLPGSSEPRPFSCWPSAGRALSPSTATSRISKPPSRICRLPRRPSRLLPTSPRRTTSRNMSVPPSTRFGTIDVSTTTPASKATSSRSTNIRWSVSPGTRRQCGRGVPGMKHVLPVMLKQNRRQHHQHRLDRRPGGIAAHCGLQRQQACGDRAHQKRGVGMHGHRRAHQLRLPRP